MAITIMARLTFATFLKLFVIPVFYAIFFGKGSTRSDQSAIKTTAIIAKATE